MTETEIIEETTNAPDPTQMSDAELEDIAEGAGIPIEEFYYGDRPGEWMPETEEEGQWVVQQIARHETDARRIKVHLERGLKVSLNAAAHFRNKYGPALERITRKVMEMTGAKGKSFRFDHATAGWRSSKPDIKITEMDRALAWARSTAAPWVDGLISQMEVSLSALAQGEDEDGGDLVRVKLVIEPNVSAIKERLEIVTPPSGNEEPYVVVRETGERVDWAVRTGGVDEFYVRVPKV